VFPIVGKLYVGKIKTLEAAIPMAKSAKNEKISGLLTSEAEVLENTKVKLTITVTPERFREGLQFAYNRSKQYFNIPGFRKGKAPRKVIEQAYGKDVFHDDALNHILPDIYEEALDKHELDPVYRPDIQPGELSEKDGANFIAIVFTRPTAEVSDYFGLTYPNTSTDATEEDIEKALKAEQEKNSRMVSVSRPAELGDNVTMNYKGYIEDEPFEGGSADEHDLKLGSGQFIPGFEDQLVGCSAGDDVSVKVTFPEDYHHADYAGKAAIFEVEVLDVKANELPEINDEFAEDVSEFDTLEEFRADLATHIKESKEKNLDNNKRNHIMKKLIALSKAEVPEEMYLGRLDDMFRDFSYNINMRGMDVENYMRFTGTSEPMLKASWRKQAERDVDAWLALEYIAKKEELVCTDEDLEKRVKDATQKEGDELAKIIEDMHPARRKEMERNILCEKALDLIMEKATASDDEEFEEDDLLEGDEDDDDINEGGIL